MRSHAKEGHLPSVDTSVILNKNVQDDRVIPYRLRCQLWASRDQGIYDQLRAGCT